MNVKIFAGIICMAVILGGTALGVQSADSSDIICYGGDLSNGQIWNDVPSEPTVEPIDFMDHQKSLDYIIYSSMNTTRHIITGGTEQYVIINNTDSDGMPVYKLPQVIFTD
jgi:hypothetical protein